MSKKYTLVEQFTQGNKKVAFALLDENKNKKIVTKQAMYYLVGKGSITNCTGQLFKDNVLLRGAGVNLSNIKTSDASSIM